MLLVSHSITAMGTRAHSPFVPEDEPAPQLVSPSLQCLCSEWTAPLVHLAGGGRERLILILLPRLGCPGPSVTKTYRFPSWIVSAALSKSIDCKSEGLFLDSGFSSIDPYWSFPQPVPLCLNYNSLLGSLKSLKCGAPNFVLLFQDFFSLPADFSSIKSTPKKRQTPAVTLCFSI